MKFANLFSREIYPGLRGLTRLGSWRRTFRFWRQRRWRGWDDSETWCLDTKIAEFVLPRLKRFQELRNGHPGTLTEPQWDEKITQMIRAFEVYVKDDRFNVPASEWPEAEKGLRTFSRWFGHLWW